VETHAVERRERLGRARLYLIFTPRLCEPRDPLAVLAAALPWVDAVQVRPKAADSGLAPATASAAQARTSARELADWTERVIALVRSSGSGALVIANDRVDVVRALLERGCDGVHVGQNDCPPRVAREVLGPEALIGLSTHSLADVARALDEPVDYLGFGPLHATETKGYERGLGTETAWVAQQGTTLAIFPIGGIDAANANELRAIGRAAVSSAILRAADPAAAARELRELLGP
jgi:thiamine-phosphate pyrophosphorylase